MRHFSRRPIPSAAMLIAFGALLGAAAPLAAEDTPQSQAQPAPPAAQHGQENRKTSATNDQSGPSNAAPTTDQHSQGDNAVHSVSGRGGKEEPGSHAPSQDTAVFVNGALNVPGAPKDSQTVPAKFSARNDKIDKLPILAMPLGLSDAQKRAVLDSVRTANVPVATVKTGPSQELPWGVEVHDLPASANVPELARLKYVRLQDRVLLVSPPNRIVVGEIAN